MSNITSIFVLQQIFNANSKYCRIDNFKKLFSYCFNNVMKYIKKEQELNVMIILDKLYVFV